MISIVVPVYNVEKYLRRCVDSVLSQTYTDWELLLIDDGSSDGSPWICDDYAACDSRIKAVHQSNAGAAAARNAGIELASGEWLTFVDSDDSVSERYLQDMLDAAVANDCDTVISGWRKDDKATVLPAKVLHHDEYMYFFGAQVNYGYILGKLYRMDMLRDHGVRFDTSVCWAEDALFFNKVLMYSRKAAVIEAVNYTYYTIEGSSVHRLHSFDKEMAGFRAAHELMPALIQKISPQVVYYFSPYAYLWRAVMSLYCYPCESDRLEILRGIQFKRSYMHNRPHNAKERIITWTLRLRQWRIIDLIMKRLYEK